jgi:CRISPR-associated protein Cas2
MSKSKYQVMWLMTMFDLPVQTEGERKAATGFRNKLLKDGYMMMQFSVYVRHCGTPQLAQVHLRRLKGMIPDKGKVSSLLITDVQYGNMVNFFGKHQRKPEHGALPQLELFL